ncbi:DDE superfamily endonuclease [Burkholderia sp. D7]|jgi:DDE superfamily endonuclease|nr:DDE superfamily endonuclease [Burkholderia sp. D7]
MTKRPTRLDYCQYLLVSPINHTLTNFADHVEDMSHDAINRFLRNEKMTPRLVWDNVREQIAAHEEGCIAFDDTIIDKDFSHRIELVRRQYSGNAHGLIKGIGMVNCVYVNPLTQEHWIIDYRIYDPDSDGKTKLDHVRDMLTNLVHHKRLPFRRVLMDTWYATRDLMLFIESLEKIYYCPLRTNRQVDDSGAKSPYRRVDSLDWDASALAHGKTIKIKGFPKHHKVKLFRVEVSTHRTDWVVTNDLTQDSSQATQDACGLRWKIEQFHREAKQLTGIERCQCRKARIQRNHIACAVLVWIRLAEIARQTCRTLYQVKHQMLDDFLRQQLKNPTVRMKFA